MNYRMWTRSALLSIAMGGSGLAGAAIINFDVDQNNASISSGSTINNSYSTLGVTLSSLQTCPTCSGTTPGNAFAVTSGLPVSSPNVFAIAQNGVPVFDSRWGAGVATFSSGQTDVGIYAAAVPFVEGLGPQRAKPFLTAYDSTNTFITFDLYGLNQGDVGYGSYQKLIVHSNTANIFSVHFSSQQPSQFTGVNSIVYGAFDNLAFGTDVSNPQSPWQAFVASGPGLSFGPDSVPEPATILLMGAALLGLARFRNTARRSS